MLLVSSAVPKIMAHQKPNIPNDVMAKWQRVVDLMATLVEVPSGLVMKTDLPDHAVLVSSRTDETNPYKVGQSFVLNSKLYCNNVLRDCAELIVTDARDDPDWSDNQDLEHGMVFYVGYPLVWPDGSLFGTICVLDRKENEKALLYRDLLVEFRSLIEGDLALLTEMEEKRVLQSALQTNLTLLEHRVVERTRDLTIANHGLQKEVARRAKTERALLRREGELEEANTALRVLLSQIETSRMDFEEQILRQIKQLVLPHVSKLKKRAGQGRIDDQYLDLLEANLDTITSSFADRLVTAFENLTPTEIEVAQMVMAGKTTKDIAFIMSRETSTIDFHRNNIRKKLGIASRGSNLRRHLLSLQ